MVLRVSPMNFYSDAPGCAEDIIRYGASLMENSLFVKAHGLTSFMEQQLERYTCPSCGGVISLHDAECSECQTKINKKEQKTPC